MVTSGPFTRQHWLEVKWKVALYVDERANQSQQDALTQIISGQAGGHLAALACEVLGVKAAPIEYRSEGKRRSLRLGDVAVAEIEGVRLERAQTGHYHRRPIANFRTAAVRTAVPAPPNSANRQLPRPFFRLGRCL